MFYLLLIILNILLFYLLHKEKKSNKNILKINEEIQKENQKYEDINTKLKQEYNTINIQIKEKQENLNNIENSVKNTEEISKHAFENYCVVLEQQYQEIEKEYEKAQALLEESYAKIQTSLYAETAQIQLDLDKISSTRTAAIQAQLKEEEIKQQSKFYSLSIDEIDKREVHVLQSIESELRDPRPIRMVIWQAYYSKKVNELCAKVLGADEITGIYKITNQNTGLCYIGQAVDIRKRWRDHIKCGLGIDTPANNKLYQAMKQEGLDNFTFEMLEACSTELLDEKEAFYINLYNSKLYGYNSTSGNKKG